MAGKKCSQPELSAEQQAEDSLIFERIREAFDQEARRLAALMASKETWHIFGEKEYPIRDRVQALGAEVLAATVEERVKKQRFAMEIGKLLLDASELAFQAKNAITMTRYSERLSLLAGCC